jgi:hypothetical protein
MTVETMTAEAKLADLKEHALRRVQDEAASLAKYLRDAQQTAENALTAMAAGQAVFGATSFGPLGHQLPFDLAVANQKLQDAMHNAMALGADATELGLAYKVGVARRW